ncbi:MAG: ImmA/IrrE family metallo-endopeptidase [Methylococcales bacterium]
MPSKSEFEAESLVEDLGLEIPIKPRDVCESISVDDCRVIYKEIEFSSNNICGLSIGSENEINVLVNSNISNSGRKLFTASHEIGHVILHIQAGIKSEFKCSESDISGKSTSNAKLEKEANEFASRLLMPTSFIGNIIKRNDINWQLIEEIATLCSTSIEATARRLVLSASESCVLIIHKDDKMWVPIKSKSFNSFIENFQFPNCLQSHSDSPRTEFPSQFEECYADIIFNNSNKLPDIIKYSSIFNKEYNKRMTLLCFPEIDDEVDEDDWDEPTF